MITRKPARILTSSIAALAAVGIFTTAVSDAASIYWDGTGTLWSAVGSWSTAVGATTPDPGAVPGAADIATFSISTVNTAQTVSLNAAQSALGLAFLGTNTAATTLQGGGTNQTLALGASGIVVNASAGAVTIGSATAGQNVAITLGAAQTWLNNASTTLTINNGVTNGANLLTIDGTGATAIAGVIGNGAGGLTKTGTGSVTLSGANTYTGVTSALGGTLFVGAAAPSGAAGALGNAASAVLLGNTSGAVNASILTSGAFTVARAITLQTGNTGTMTLGGNTAAASVFSGAVLLGTSGAVAAKNVTLVALSGGSVDFSGVFNENTSNTTVANVTIGDATHSGTVKLSNAANAYSGITTIGNGATLEATTLAAGGSNSSIGNSGSSAAAGSAATDLVIDNGTLKYSGAVVSTNRLFTIGAGGATIDANGTSNAALTFSGTGSLVASGSGNRTLTLTGASTGANTMTSIIANPTTGTTALSKTGAGLWVLGGANTFTGGTTVTAGTLRGIVAGSFGANTGAAAISLGGGTLELLNDTGTTFTNTGTTVTTTSTVSANRATSAATTTTHTLGALSIGAQTLNVTRGANITGAGIGGITFGATTLTGNATFAPAASAQLSLGAVGGAFSLTQNGAGTTVLTAAGTYSGGTTISAGILQLNNATAAGTNNTITLPNSGSGRLFQNGGVTTNYNLVVGTGQAGATGQGLLSQTGTGQATFNGTITLNGLSGAGGVFLGNNTAGNELVIGGAINGASNLGLSQRDGRVIYKGGGTVGGTFTATGTVLVGATNGLPVALVPTLGGSAAATLDLNGFDQAIAALNLGNAGAANNNLATVNLGTKTLTLNGDLSTISTATANVSHQITSGVGGTISVGATQRNFTVADTLAADDLVITGAAISGTGGIVKAGAGTLLTRNVTVTGPLVVNAGTIALSQQNSSNFGSLTTGSLAFGAGATTIRMRVGTGLDIINGGTVTTAGTATFNLIQQGGLLAASTTYPLINYTGTSPGLGGFALGTLPGHVLGSLSDTGTAIALTVTGNDKVVWDATTDGNWNINTTANWLTQLGGTSTNYFEGDAVVFQDSPTGATAGAVTLVSNVVPNSVEFTNTIATPYTVAAASAIGINGATGLTKTGNGVVTLRTANAYVGATTISNGTLELDHDVTGNVVLSATSGVSVASGATLNLTRDDGNITFNRNISGAGTVVIDPHTAAGTAVRDVAITGTNTGFSGLWKLSPSNVGAAGLGSFRTNASMTPTTLGTAAVQVDNGGQLWLANNTYTNNITITGTGYAEAAGGTPVGGTGFTYGGIGAIRIDGGATLAGTLTLNGNAKIQSFNGTATVSGSVGVTNSSDLLVIGGGSNGTTIIFTGTNNTGASPLNNVWINSGGTAGSQRLNIGSGGTAGTLGVGTVTIHGDAASNGVLGFDRSDGYTLTSGQTITADGTFTTTFIDFDTTGAGFDNAGNAITLGTTASGGNLRFGQARANTVTSLTGNVTAQNFNVGSNAPGATVNLNNTANVNADFVQLGLGLAVNVANTLNINNGSTVTAKTFFAGQVSGGIGIVNQAAGSAVNVDAQLRLGHFPNNTSVYNLSGGNLTLTGASPLLTPSTATGGGVSATGDNNINALATVTILGGGIYLGNDGTGVMNHTGGTVTTNWIVLDNRVATGPGVNTPDGIDRYNISGSAILNLRSAWGMRSGNITGNEGSYAVSFGGGTIRVDNTGTGGPAGNTGANLTVPLDVTVDTVAASTTTLDTNGATNAFTLSRDIRGTGTLALTGGGAINLSTAGLQGISPSLSGANPVNKIGAGITTLSGASSGYTGPITVSAGRLNVNGALGATSSITVADGAILSGEPTVDVLTLGTTTGTTLFFNPTPSGALTATTLNAPANTVLDFSAPVPGDGTYPALSFGSKSGSGTFSLAGAANYRSAVVNEGPTAVDVVISNTKALVWLAAGGSTWDVNTTTNWGDSANANAPDKFFSADVVTFDDTSVGGTAVTVTAGVAPALVQVSGTTNNFTLTSTGAGIAGGAIEKDGSTTFTLVGPNTYPGKTTVRAGILSIADPVSLGGGGVGNTISLSNGGTLAYTGAVAANLGTNRNIAIGTGGGTISHRNATAATITIPGNLSGSGALALNSTLAGGGTFLLSGSNNSAYTGAITVDSIGTGLSTLNFASQASVPNASSITLNYPAAGVTGNATTLTLNGVTLLGATTLNMTSFLNGAISLRSQVTNTGNSTINGPITASGTTIVQMSITNGTLTLNGNVTAGGGGFNGPSSVFFLRGAAGNGVVNGMITLPGAQLSKTDANSWTINSTGNDWLTTGVLVGTVRMGANGALPAASNLVLGQNDANTAVLALDGFSQTVGSLASNPTTVGANTTGKSITSTTAATLTVNQSSTTTYASVLTGAVALTKEGIGSLTISGVNSQTGATTINGGVLKLGSNTAMGTNTAVTIANGATLDVGGVANNAATRYVVSVSGAGVAGQAAIWNSGGGQTNNPVYGTLNLTGDTSIGGINRYDLNGGTGGTTINGGTFTLTKVGANETWWAPNAGATVGNIVIDGGTFGVQSSNNLGSAAHKIIINSAGTLNTFGGQTNTKDIEINGGILATNNNTNSWNGTITLSGTGTTNRVSPGVGLLLNLGGKVTGAQGFEKLTTGTVELQSALNDWQGETKVSAGTLRVSATGILSTATTLDMNGGTVDLNGTAQTVAGLKGATGVINSVAAGSLVVNQSGSTVYGGTITGLTSLTKSGAGILELGGTSTTTGATLISDGVLRVSGSISGSAVTVSGTGTLGGIGSVGSLSLDAGGTLAPGVSPGILNAGNTSFNGGTAAIEIFGSTAGTGYDQLNVTGTVAFTANTPLTIDLGAFDPSGGSFTLVNNDGTDPVNLGGFGFTYLGTPLAEGDAFVVSGNALSISYAGGSNNNDIVIVPEPGAVAMLLGGVGMLLGLQRRRRKA